MVIVHPHLQTILTNIVCVTGKLRKIKIMSHHLKETSLGNSASAVGIPLLPPQCVGPLPFRQLLCRGKDKPVL